MVCLVHENIGIKNMLVVDYREGGRRRGGGLAIFWKEDVAFNLVSMSANHIHASLTGHNNVASYLTGFYGYPEAHNKHKSWELLQHLSSSVNGP